MKKEQIHIDETMLLRIIENTASMDEISLFKSWMDASEQNAKDFEQLKKTYQLVNIDENSLKRNWDSVVQKVQEGNKVGDYIELPNSKTLSIDFKKNNLIRLAAMLIVLLGISVLLKTIVFDSKQLIIAGNDININEPFKLADGSIVYLNRNSEISFSKDFGKDNRNLSLKGEAFFEVKRNEELPFRITTLESTVEVLGTSFNIYSDESEEVKVSVVSGLVAFSISKQDETLMLKAGEQGIYSADQTGVRKEKLKDNNFLAWKTGVLKFEETPLQEAIQLIQKYYLREIVFEGEHANFPNLTTTFDNQPLEAVLDELNLLLNTKHEIINDTIIFKPNS